MSPMQCPICQTPMQEGAVRMGGGMERFLVAGFSWESVWFETEGAAKRPMLESGERREAYRCAACDALVLPGTRGR
jgi:hypothetical protein